MSHSKIGEMYTFMYNSDMSGPVSIVNRITGERFEVDGHELLDFVARYVRMNKISRIEQMTVEELLCE